MKLNNNDDSHNSGLNLLIYNMLLDIGHTLRGCVDWNDSNSNVSIYCAVTPCVGVWIETTIEDEYPYGEFVTPCVGVWIETGFPPPLLFCPPSHPAWVCGLKPIEEQQVPTPHCHTLRGCVDWNSVAYRERICIYCHTLRGCVDWNVQSNMQTLSNAVSHPAWVCGLKPDKENEMKLYEESHPAWVCGLKPLKLWFLVALIRHTLRGCVDWNRTIR